MIYSTYPASTIYFFGVGECSQCFGHIFFLYCSQKSYLNTWGYASENFPLLRKEKRAVSLAAIARGPNKKWTLIFFDLNKKSTVTCIVYRSPPISIRSIWIKGTSNQSLYRFHMTIPGCMM